VEGIKKNPQKNLVPKRGKEGSCKRCSWHIKALKVPETHPLGFSETSLIKFRLLGRWLLHYKHLIIFIKFRFIEFVLSTFGIFLQELDKPASKKSESNFIPSNVKVCS
jgi:hypothetical protein